MWKLFTILLAVLCVFLAIGLFACYWERGWLTIDNAADLFSIFASISVVVSLLFIAFQVQQQVRLARASNSQSFVNVVSDFVLAAGSNATLMEFYQTGGDKFETLDPPEQARYRYLVAWWLTFYENVQYQQDCGLLDEGVYKAWMKDMQGFVERRRVDKVWDQLKTNYSDTFVAHIQPFIDSVRAKNPSLTPPQKP